jgi:hypothetical protein
MKKSILLILFFSTICYSSLLAQNINSNISLKLEVGSASTLHHDRPVTLDQCEEGCFAEEQNAEITFNYNLSIYKALNQRNSVKIGVGRFNYKYNEKGQAGVGDGSFAEYQYTIERNFFNLFVGYKYTFNPEKKVKYFLEGYLIYKSDLNNYESLNGLAFQPSLGLQLQLTDRWHLSGNAFFRTAFTDYSDINLVNSYRPYGFGLSAAIHLKL